MKRYFNTTGPCMPELHYMLPPEGRLPAMLPYIEQQQYFVVHAARQTGKTTAMRAFAERLRGMGYAAVWATLETSQEITEIEKVELLWLSTLRSAAERVLPMEQQPLEPDQSWSTGDRLRLFLSTWSAKLDKPLVLLLDEADTISGPALVSFLRQLRSGFSDRGIGKFPTSIALIGMRDLKDYLTRSKDGGPVNPGSPFNVKKASLTLRNFTKEEIESLYSQHTEQSGQLFTREAVDRSFYWTQGQPFLVNALADLCVQQELKAPITKEHIEAAKEQLILSRTTHLDALGERLKEERVARVIQAILLGDQEVPYGHDDYLYCVDLGLVLDHPDGARAANPLYQEVLIRELTYHRQRNLQKPWWKWQKPDGALDMAALIDEFLKWWRLNEQSISAHGNKIYPEALPHLTFMAFLQRVVNGGGLIHREFAAGRGAIDLVVEYGGVRHAIELKRVVDRSREEVVEAGVGQLASYLETLGEKEGWLLVFDQHKKQSWEQRLWREERVVEGKRLFLRGA